MTPPIEKIGPYAYGQWKWKPAHIRSEYNRRDICLPLPVPKWSLEVRVQLLFHLFDTQLRHWVDCVVEGGRCERRKDEHVKTAAAAAATCIDQHRTTVNAHPACTIQTEWWLLTPSPSSACALYGNASLHRKNQQPRSILYTCWACTRVLFSPR